ncbi:MAG: hypothetical protein AMJ54_04530 [Deltaproteobacteria bacterium SG8_13]|nr:MAG: hypothetical protein AMJ54_04530 [Deltaproteobacteria bacterium SG8_13]
MLPAVLSVLWVADAGASERTLRCRGRLVSIGDSASEVKQICGEPDQILHRQEGHNTAVARIFDYETERYQAPVRVDTPIRVEIWIYDPDPTRLVRTLYFENGRLIRIETGPKVGD